MRSDAQTDDILVRDTLTSRRAATMADVARVAGVTKMTVSYAFSGKRPIAESTRLAILQAARELNFAPNAHAQRLASGANGREVCLYSVNLSAGVDILKVNLIRRMLQEENYNVSFHSNDASGQQGATMQMLRTQRPAAIVSESTDLSEAARVELERFCEEGGLVVCYGAGNPLRCDHVFYDHEAALYLAAKHLIDLGHRRLGLHILGPARRHEPEFVRLSNHGFERAAAEFRIDAPRQWRFRGLNYENHEEGGADTAEQWLARPRSEWPTGVCFVNDTAASAFVAAMTRAGVRIPRDLSVVSTDDLPVARYSTVPLTTVTHPIQEVASRVVHLLLDRLEGRATGEARCLTVRGELVVRESTAPPFVP